MSETIRVFNRSAGGYDDWYKEAKGQQALEAESALIDELIPASGVGLEIGAGTGVFAVSLTGDDRIIVCLDLSTEMLTRARQRGLPCVLGSAEFLPMRPRALGFIYMITVIEFLPAPVKAFGEAVKIGAPLVVLFVNRDSSWGRLYAAMADQGDAIFRLAHLYSPEEVAELAQTAGLAEIEAYGTLTTGPTDPEAGDDITEPSTETGVVAIKFTVRGA